MIAKMFGLELEILSIQSEDWRCLVCFICSWRNVLIYNPVTAIPRQRLTGLGEF